MMKIKILSWLSMMRDAGKIETGKFLLEDGKVLTLARKLSPVGFTCVDNYVDQCGGFYRCCGDLQCTSPILGGDAILAGLPESYYVAAKESQRTQQNEITSSAASNDTNTVWVRKFCRHNMPTQACQGNLAKLLDQGYG
uniref:Uncharacterized protein n=1 Tax=Tanacetum cinerariifolium TaxID=118510 RepID=A0A699GHI7_TANCI|nr:hypothetical protein [Tanacetum cinerariifolium]